MIRKWMIAGLFLITACAAAYVGSRRQQPPSPSPMLTSSGNSLDAQTCSECHADIVDQFRDAPHQLTLRRVGDDGLWERFAGRSVDTRHGTFRFEGDARRLQVASDRFPESADIDWIFGSGQHALTPAVVYEDVFGEIRMQQPHVSWFAGDVLGLTPGSDETPIEPPSLGISHTPQETAECFGCHATYLPREKGRIELGQMLPGVSCSRCHPGGREHVAADGATATTTDWHSLTPLESVNRCGECHRRADQMTEDEIDVLHAGRLARFAPVGLVQSRCFTEQFDFSPDGSMRMDCLTCHDPHSPAETDPGYYRRRCLQCHGDQPHHAASCPQEPPTSNCLSCHMPKISTLEHLWFTDHWIRVDAGAASK